MGIPTTVVEQIVSVIGDDRPDELILGALKEQFSGIRITACFDDDIHHGKPVHTSPYYAIYLVGNNEHCLSLTNDYDIATGVVIAEIIEE